MDREGGITTAKRVSLAVFAGGVLLLTCWYAFRGQDFTVALELLVALVLSAGVLVLGIWLAVTDTDGDTVCYVCRWTVLATAGAILIAGWVMSIEYLHNELDGDVGVLLLTAMTVGLAAGAPLGLHRYQVRRATRELAARSNRLEEFAGIVAHDLRNPVNIAQGHLEMARETGSESHFDAMESSLDRMDQLSREVLSLAREEIDEHDVESVKVAAVAHEAWTYDDHPGATLEIETDRAVLADRFRLQTLFENLFQNSVDYSDCAVTVTVGDIEDGIYVADDGPGIPAEQRERVFEGGYTTRADRAGFGLAIVRQIAEAHDWEHRFADATQGTRFELTGMAD